MERRLVGEHRDGRDLGVRPGHERGEGGLALAAADHRAARRDAKDDPPDARAARRLEHVVRADDIAPRHRLERRAANCGGQVHDLVDPGERGLDRREIRDVRLVAFSHSATVGFDPLLDPPNNR